MRQAENKVLYLLTGPTAVGKTALAIDWAIAHNAEILSCDSLLFYKGMDIGTAKPTASELAAVPHHGIDLVPVSQQFSVIEYQDYAGKLIKDIISRGKNVLITGGSGFYLKSFLAPISDGIEVPADLIQSLEAELNGENGLANLVNKLKQLSPSGTGKIHLENPIKVIKAIARCIISKKEIPELEAAFASQEAPYPDFAKKVCLLSRSPESLRARVLERVYLMLEAGLINEVTRLLDEGIMRNPSACRAIGYRETIDYIQQGENNLKVLAEQITINTNQLIRKQRIWFRHQLNSHNIVALDENPSLSDLF